MASATFTENTTAQNSADTTTTGVTEDTFLQETDGGTVNHGTNTILEATKYAVNDHNHTLLRFDTSSIAASVTVSAATLYWYHTGNNGEGHNLEAREILQTAWTEGGATFLTYDGSTGWAVDGCLGSGTDRVNTPESTTAISSTTGEYKAVDLTGLVTANIGGSIEVHLAMDTGESSDYMQFASSEGTDGQRPELVVVYTVAGTGDLLLTNRSIANFSGMRQ